MADLVSGLASIARLLELGTQLLGVDLPIAAQVFAAATTINKVILTAQQQGRDLTDQELSALDAAEQSALAQWDGGTGTAPPSS
jgi:hypothetical protein